MAPDPVMNKVYADSFFADTRYDEVNQIIEDYKVAVAMTGEPDSELLERMINSIGIAIPAIQNALMSAQKVSNLPSIPAQVAHDIEVRQKTFSSRLAELSMMDSTVRNMVLSKIDYVKMLSELLSPYYATVEVEEDFSGFQESEEEPIEEEEQESIDEEDPLAVYNAQDEEEEEQELVEEDENGDEPIIFVPGENGYKKVPVDIETLEPIMSDEQENEEPYENEGDTEEPEEYQIDIDTDDYSDEEYVSDNENIAKVPNEMAYQIQAIIEEIELLRQENEKLMHDNNALIKHIRESQKLETERLSSKTEEPKQAGPEVSIDVQEPKEEASEGVISKAIGAVRKTAAKSSAKKKGTKRTSRKRSTKKEGA